VISHIVPENPASLSWGTGVGKFTVSVTGATSRVNSNAEYLLLLDIDTAIEFALAWKLTALAGVIHSLFKRLVGSYVRPIDRYHAFISLAGVDRVHPR